MGSIGASGQPQQEPRRRRSALDEIAYQHFRRAERRRRIMTILTWTGGVLAFVVFVYFALSMVTGGSRANPHAPPVRSRR